MGFRLFHLEALAVRAFHHSGVALMGANLDGVQAAVIRVLAVMGAVVDGAFDALVGRTSTAAVSAILRHGKDPPAR